MRWGDDYVVYQNDAQWDGHEKIVILSRKKKHIKAVLYVNESYDADLEVTYGNTDVELRTKGDIVCFTDGYCVEKRELKNDNSLVRNDSKWIVLFVNALTKLDLRTCNSLIIFDKVIETILHIDKIYLQKYYGNLAGNKFGF